MVVIRIFEGLGEIDVPGRTEFDDPLSWIKRPAFAMVCGEDHKREVRGYCDRCRASTGQFNSDKTAPGVSLTAIKICKKSYQNLKK